MAAGGAAAGAVAGSAAANIPKSGFWGMSQDGEESNELEPLQFETENGTVTLRDENANGVYDAVVVEPSETEEAAVETQSEYEAIPVSESTEEPAEFSALEVTATPVSESDFDEMSFSEAFASAREELGAGGVFTWNGNAYNTFYKEEWEGMSSEEKQDYQAAVSQVGTENEHLNAVATAQEEAKAAAWLVKHTENQPTQTYTLKVGRNTIGRKASDYPVPDIQMTSEDDPYVSRGVHCTVEVVERNGQIEAIISDNGSSNGTFINGRDYRLSPSDEEYLKDGETIQAGRTKFVLKTNRSAASKKEAGTIVQQTDYSRTIIS